LLHTAQFLNKDGARPFDSTFAAWGGRRRWDRANAGASGSPAKLQQHESASCDREIRANGWHALWVGEAGCIYENVHRALAQAIQVPQ